MIWLIVFLGRIAFWAFLVIFGLWCIYGEDEKDKQNTDR